MQLFLAIWTGKITLFISKFLKLGAGGTWPGEIGLTIHPKLISELINHLSKGIVIVAGTNGKTTTSLMIDQILIQAGFKTIHNATGANLLNGIASVLIQSVGWTGKIEADYGVFEVDENSLPAAIFNLQFSIHNYKKKIILVLLNLFRDQLDRYGEVDMIAEKWGKALLDISHQSSDVRHGTNLTMILNADDPLIAHLGKNFSNVISNKVRDPIRLKKDNGISLRQSADRNDKYHILFFGINDPKQFIPKLEHATDSIFCLNCGGRLSYTGIYFSHLGIWQCEKCGEKRPVPDISNFSSTLPGLYNKYNTLAAVSVSKALRIDEKKILQALQDFTPAFGRQEEFIVDGKKVKIYLSKNPAGYNASLRTVLELKPKVLLLALNDRIPDGRDVSWIWDVDFETIPKDISIIVSGDRVYDMALRIKYAVLSKKSKVKSQKFNSKVKIEADLKKALFEGLKMTRNNETLYILPTYSAMLEIRKILTGKKIL